MRYRTIHHQHDINGGMFFALLMGFKGFSLLVLAGIAWLGFLFVQDFFSEAELTPDQYQIKMSEGVGQFTGVEQASIEQEIKIVNRSDIALTTVDTRQRVFMCPPDYRRIGDCNKVVDKPETHHADIAPGEGKVINLGSTIYPFGSRGNEIFIVRTNVLTVKGDEDKEV